MFTRKSFHRIPVVIWLLIASYVVVFTIVNILEYRFFLYDGLDLGIYDQVIWNTSAGRWFEYSFNPYSYLVDHREWFLVLFVPLYWIFGHPITLLVVQTVALASAALPLFLLVRYLFADSEHRDRIGVVAVILYFLQPQIGSMNVFEFHLLTFAVPLLFWLWLFIERGQWRKAFACMIALLLLREDVSLVVAGVGLLILLTRRVHRSRTLGRGIWMIVCSFVTFATMVSIGSWLSPEGVEKFFVFYDWLGDTPAEAWQSVLQHPLWAISVLFDYYHPIALLFLFANAAFLPLFALRYLVPTLGPLLLYFSLDQPMLFPVLKSHYAAVLVPWIVIASLYGYRSLRKRQWFQRLEKEGVLVLIIIVFAVAQWASLGPLWTLIHEFRLVQSRDLAYYRSVVESIDEDDVVMVSNRFYPFLSHRRGLHPSLHLFTGRQHFANISYTPPDRLDWLILEQEQILNYGIQLPPPWRTDAWQRFQQLIDANNLAVVDLTEDLIVFGRSSPSRPPLKMIERSPQELEHSVGATINNDIVFVGWEYESEDTDQGTLLLSFEKKGPRPIFEDDEHFSLTWYDGSGNVLEEKLFALGFGFDPSHSWEVGTENRRLVRLPIDHPEGTTRIEISIGPLKKQFGPFFTLWSAEPVLDPDRTTTFPLEF